MNCQRMPKQYLISELKDLVENWKNEQLQKILQGTKPSDWVCDNETTLLHMAVDHKNRELIKYLLDAGYDVNVKNAIGQTALITALKSRDFDTVKILLEANADANISDPLIGQSAMKIFIRRWNTGYFRSMSELDSMIMMFFKNLKNSNLNPQQLAEILVDAKCLLLRVLILNDIDVTREFLKCKSLEGDDSSTTMLAMVQLDFETVQRILRDGDESRRIAFYDNLVCLFESQQMQVWRAFIDVLPHWNVVSQEAIAKLSFMFLAADEEQLKILLDSKIHEQVQSKLRIDLRTAMFGNKKVNAIEIIRNHRDFDVNVSGHYEWSALHYAVTYKNVECVKFLLNASADVNFRNTAGITPLFLSTWFNHLKIVELLLKHGADVQLVTYNGLTVFDLPRIDRDRPVQLEYPIAQLALDKVQGIPIKEMIEDRIHRCSEDEQKYKAFYQQLEVLKTREIVESVNFFALLTSKAKTFFRSLYHRKNTTALLEQYKNHNELHPYYYCTLKDKLTAISNFYTFRVSMAKIIFEGTGKLISFDHLIIDKMSRYLTEDDVYRFSESISRND